MESTFVKKTVLIVILVKIFFSCSSDLDFDQANDLNVHPIVASNLAYINLNASDFVVNGAESPVFSDTTDVDFFGHPFIEDNLAKAELYFRIKNTIDRAYIFNVAFLNKNNNLIYNIKIEVPKYSGTEVMVEKTVIFAAANLVTLENTTKMIFSVRMLSGTLITNTTPGRVELSSSLTAYFDVK
ncbi:hypothetical protein [Flavobacterium sp. WC2509]|uniref:hypothetical protein n=1 Tax=Flavobacterium sp. WC2509 TaxID=3461406 RepID=UPI004043B58F